MIIDKNYKNLKRLGNRNYFIKGDLIVEEELEVNLDVWLEVEGLIKVKGKIISNKTIKAGRYIEAGYSIVAMLQITAKSYISARLRIFAGTCSWKSIEEKEKTVTCSALKNGEIVFGTLNIVKPIKEISMQEAQKILKEKFKQDVKIINE